MKTNEEKILKLLQVAVENGWNNKTKMFHIDLNENTFSIDEGTLLLKQYFQWLENIESLNDLVCNCKEGEVSFIEALCRESDKNHRGVLEKT